MRFATKATIASIAFAGATGIFFIGKNNHEDISPDRQQVVYLRQEPAYSKPQINVEAFNRYQNSFEEKYRRLSESRRIDMREVPIPDGIPVPNDGINIPRAFAFDINGDGVEEIYLEAGCGGSGNNCWGSIYQNTGSGYAEILNGTIDRVSSQTINGFPIAFDIRPHYLPRGGSTDVTYEYTWNGQKLVLSDILITPENLPSVAENIRIVFESEQDPAKRSDFLRELDASIGAHYTLQAFMQSHLSSNFPILSGSELTDYLILYDKETDANFSQRYPNDPAGFERATLSHVYDRLFFDMSPESLSLAGISAAAKSVAKDMKMDSQSQLIERVDRLENRSGDVSAFRNLTGRNPTLREWLDFKYRTNALTEDRLRAIPRQDRSDYKITESPSGTVESRSFSPTDVVGDPSYRDSQPRIDERQQQQERARQMDEETQDTIRREGGRIIDDARQRLDNIFKPQEKK